MLTNTSLAPRLGLHPHYRLPPPIVILTNGNALGFVVTDGYGLTETNNFDVSCTSRGEQWNGLPIKERARMKTRQGVGTALSWRQRMSLRGRVERGCCVMGRRSHEGSSLLFVLRSCLPFFPKKAAFHCELTATVSVVEMARRLCVDLRTKILDFDLQ